MDSSDSESTIITFPPVVWIKRGSIKYFFLFWYICPASHPKSQLVVSQTRTHLVRILKAQGYTCVPLVDPHPINTGEVWVKKSNPNISSEKITSI